MPALALRPTKLMRTQPSPREVHQKRVQTKLPECHNRENQLPHNTPWECVKRPMVTENIKKNNFLGKPVANTYDS